jgi:hypothetical protein
LGRRVMVSLVKKYDKCLRKKKAESQRNRRFRMLWMTQSTDQPSKNLKICSRKRWVENPPPMSLSNWKLKVRVLIFLKAQEVNKRHLQKKMQDRLSKKKMVESQHLKKSSRH